MGMTTRTAEIDRSGTSGVRQARRNRAKAFAKRFIAEFRDDDVTGLASEIAYNVIFAIPPLIILTITIASLINQFTDVPIVENLRTIVQEQAPGEAQDVLNLLIDNAVAQMSGGLASFGAIFTALLAVWSGSNAVNSLVKSFNRAYDVKEQRGMIRLRLTTLGLTLLMAVLVNLAFVLFVFGGSIGEWVANLVGLGSLFTTIWNIARWPLGVIFFMFVLAILYYAGPNVKQSFRWISPGSIVATILWLIAVFGFRVYLQFSNPGSAYGVFGGVIVLLFFLYVSGIIFVIGAELNAMLQKRYDEETVRDRAQHPEKLEDEEDRLEARQQAVALQARGSDVTMPAPASGTDTPSTPYAHHSGNRIAALLAALLAASAAAGALAGWLLRGRSGATS